MPVNNPKAKAAASKARNGCNLNVVDEKIINRIHNTSIMINNIEVLF